MTSHSRAARRPGPRLPRAPALALAVWVAGSMMVTPGSAAASRKKHRPHRASQTAPAADRSGADGAHALPDHHATEVQVNVQAKLEAKVADPERGTDSTSGDGTSLGSASSSLGGADSSAGPVPGGRPAKTRVYTFGAMDVEGKLKTPQLLYFLNRIKLELEMSAPDERSFMKELAKSADDPNL